ncbi:hypothetical protein [Delftia phage PhiW-14]|uniref:Uncharacterized protein n=1 Tax=Delftia phage PhiW-14 TaxID=665032 RepID=C9DG63_BPW14|nr:hypothetical protein DP-phiW-14_gp093 [Delftia phage PhiW-14]ACV50114.1 hypothetical protein [Delftia phage PhiW-14]
MPYTNADIPVEKVKQRLIMTGELLHEVADHFEQYNKTEDKVHTAALADVLVSKYGWRRVHHDMIVLHGACWWSSRGGLAISHEPILHLYSQYSGDPSYPVPSPEQSVSAKDAFCKGQPDMWIGQYGRDRIGLLRLVANQATACAELPPLQPIFKKEVKHE